MKNNNEMIAEKIAAGVKNQGGTCYYVGGYVRDRLMGMDNKDVDIEVHGITPDKLQNILSQIGEVTTMGASFGIYGLKHCDIDIAMPRLETANGKGHRDFEVFTDPFLGTKKAALRRDFTVNALMQDVLSGEVLDYFGGTQDLHNGILRHVNDVTFAEDPLRVLRGAQFAARFHFQTAPETLALCAKMDLTALAKERIMGELQKALLKADTPSVFFTFLRDCHQLKDWFCEIEALIGVKQSPVYHPEGDVFNHTMLTLDAAAAFKREAKQPLYFMLAALCHDLGKITATTYDNGEIRSLGHEDKSVVLAEHLLKRLTNENQMLKYVTNMAMLHRKPNLYASQKAGKKAMNRLFDEAVCPEDLLLLAKADRVGQKFGGDYTPTAQYLQDALRHYYEIMSLPFVKGEDLVKAGIKPGKIYAEALKFAHNLRLSEVGKEDALKQTLALF